MNFLNHIYKLAINNFKLFTLLCALFALASCADDLGIRVDEEAESFTGITLYIPDVEAAAEYGATRSDGNANTRAYDTSKESNFNTLYIVAVEKKSEDGTNYQTEILHTFYKNQYDRLEGAYKVYNIGLSPGNYKFYVVANLNRYLYTSSGADSTFPTEATSEDKIRELILNFNSEIPLEPGFLPMACLHENIQVGSTSDSGKTKVNGKDDLIEITKDNTKRIYADLNYLCSKVRYTILFDRNEAKEFGASDIIDIHRDVSTSATPFATNLRYRTPIDPTVHLSDQVDASMTIGGDDQPQGQADGSTATSSSLSYFVKDSNGNIASWPIPLSRYNYDVKINNESDPFNFYDENKSNEDIKKALDALTPWTTGTWTAGEYLNKRAWQGIAYLPENLISDIESESDLLTVLGFPYSFNGRESENPKKLTLDWSHDDSDDYGLKRAKSYDVIALIKTPDAADMVVNVMIEDWTLQQLAYDLHGPYELIVENSYVPSISMEEEAVFWFRTDLDPSLIELVSPTVSVSKEVGKDMQPLFKGGVMKDDKGNYILNENGDYIFHVGLNTEIPYTIIDGLNRNGISYTYKENGQDRTVTYYKDDIAFFHLQAGSLMKRIEIQNLNLDPYLKVTPQTIIIDTRERYTSGEDNPLFNITFETNVRPTDDGVSLIMTDIKALSGGIADALELNNPKNYKSLGNNKFELNEQEGHFVLNCYDIITGNEFWNKNSEYELKFTLTISREDDENNKEPLVVEKTVVIKVRPFSGNYIIHFRDNTKPWMEPHIYIFQDLTLPSDMTVMDNQGNETRYEHAGRIVGYVEDNPTSGWQWNAAVQYVFTNNLSFRGWYGNHKAIMNDKGEYEPLEGNEYGGPEINNPWAKATWTDTYQNLSTYPGGLNSTMGFVMFGDPISSNYEGHDRSLWNYQYSYTNVDKIPDNLNEDRWQRYNYKVNFNYDHEQSWDYWGCQNCQGLSPDYNKGGNRFYTGISLEREEDGWWKYTLTGVAQPGRSVVIFANWHEPWMEIERDYRAEDYRWPGDYEAGLPLFDFEDNEGWFLFDGNTTNADQKFTDDKPVADVIPHIFSEIYSQMNIDVVNPSNVNIAKVEIGHQTKYLGADNQPYEWSKYEGTPDYNTKKVNPTYHKDFELGSTQIVPQGTGNVRLTFTLPTAAYKYENLVVRIYTDNSNYKQYVLAPKFFVKDGATHKSAEPLYLEFTKDIKLFVKWNDVVKLKQDWGGDYAYYQPPDNGSPYLSLYWGSNSGNLLKTVSPDKKEYGNYKYKTFTLDGNSATGSNAKDKLSLRLCTNENGTGNYYKILKVEDLPQYYNPAYKYYQINWHILAKP